MRPFLNLFVNSSILVVVDYVLKWVEVISWRTNYHMVVIHFLKELFARFGMPKAIISEWGLHFYNKPFEKFMQKY